MKFLILLSFVGFSLQSLTDFLLLETFQSDTVPAEPDQFPYQVALNVKINGLWFFCSGTLISTEWVLTAAHCVQNSSLICIIMGTVNANGDGGIIVESKEYYVHEDYVPFWFVNDIGLIKLESPAEESDSIKPASLPTSKQARSGIASGWSKVETNLNIGGSTLQYKNAVVLLSAEQGLVESEEKLMIGEPTCFRGSGGPLVLDDSDTLVGIGSYESDWDCILRKPAQFTRVFAYLDWINSITDMSTEET